VNIPFINSLHLINIFNVLKKIFFSEFVNVDKIFGTKKGTSSDTIHPTDKDKDKGRTLFQLPQIFTLPIGPEGIENDEGVDMRLFLYHLCLAEDGWSDPPGIKVRAVEGLAGCDYLSHSTLIKKSSYV
jgi:hypothetical protein